MTEQSQKRVAYYNSLVNAWIQTRMEVDKTLIIISSAGIGVLMTILTNKGIVCITDFIIYIAALISFFVVIILCIVVLRINSNYIYKLLENSDSEDKWLDALDNASKWFFALALIFTLMVGISTGYRQLYQNLDKKGEQEMSEKKGKGFEKNESLKGLDKLNPSKKTDSSSKDTNISKGNSEGKK